MNRGSRDGTLHSTLRRMERSVGSSGPKSCQIRTGRQRTEGNTIQEIALLTLILFQSCKDTYRLSVSLEPAGIGHATVERSLKKRVLVEPNRRALVTLAKATPR